MPLFRLLTRTSGHFESHVTLGYLVGHIFGISHRCTISADVDFIFWKYSGAYTHTRHHQAPIPSQYLLQSWQAAQCRGSITTRGNNGGYVNPGGFFWKILLKCQAPSWSQVLTLTDFYHADHIEPQVAA